MAEKRRPTFVFLLKNHGMDGKVTKTNKVECFPEKLFRKDGKGDKMYRLRVNGKWFPKEQKGYKFFYKTQVVQMLARSINFDTWH